MAGLLEPQRAAKQAIADRDREPVAEILDTAVGRMTQGIGTRPPGRGYHWTVLGRQP